MAEPDVWAGGLISFNHEQYVCFSFRMSISAKSQEVRAARLYHKASHVQAEAHPLAPNHKQNQASRSDSSLTPAHNLAPAIHHPMTSPSRSRCSLLSPVSPNFQPPPASDIKKEPPLPLASALCLSPVPRHHGDSRPEREAPRRSSAAGGGVSEQGGTGRRQDSTPREGAGGMWGVSV